MLGSLSSSSIKLTFLFQRLTFSSILQYVIKYGALHTSRETKITGHGTQQLLKRQQGNPDSARFGAPCSMWNSLLQTQCPSSFLQGI